jgi:hypothetical protein
MRNNLKFRGNFTIQTNIGILGDAIGSGKTVLALSIVASVPVTHIHKRSRTIQSYEGHTGAYMLASMDNAENTQNTTFGPKLQTTLIIVPRGPVYTQFVEAIEEQTTLSVLCIDCITTIKRIMPKPTATSNELRDFIEKYDAVLVKNTALKMLHEYYGNTAIIMSWARIIIDEACDTLTESPIYYYNFMWMISATYNQLLNLSTSYRYKLSYSIRDVIVNNETINHLLVKCTDQFIAKSFNVPAPIESFYVCDLPRQLAAVHSF